MIEFICAFLLVFLIHELGHIVAIMIFNVTESKPFYHLRFEWNIKYFYVVHEKFTKQSKNILVAVSGPILPVLLSLILIFIINNQFTKLFTLLRFVNLTMLHPRFPDGRNIINAVKEWKGN
ncbi:hypothetical protein AS888_15365 [Peribacillus simplex]|uniref:Uncharacterized protein n=1 Tax=Peribacillus simplex TaxID=1478 RepID=A0A120GQA1_9BACI|nr:hypothetical protein AS888_15365 [Peribacillus simplex]